MQVLISSGRIHKCSGMGILYIFPIYASNNGGMANVIAIGVVLEGGMIFNLPTNTMVVIGTDTARVKLKAQNTRSRAPIYMETAPYRTTWDP